MFFLTKQERTVLIIFSFLFFLGIIFDVSLKKYPQLNDIVNLIDSDRLINKLDVNKAAKEELDAIPYIGNFTAEAIIRYREENGPVKDLAELKNIPGIREKNYQKFVKFLKVEK